MINERPELDPIFQIKERVDKLLDKYLEDKKELIAARKKLAEVKKYCDNGGLFSQWRVDIKKIL